MGKRRTFQVDITLETKGKTFYYNITPFPWHNLDRVFMCDHTNTYHTLHKKA